MNLDIYTSKPIVEESLEHILLNSLGGKWEVKSLIDRDTNTYLGLTIDKDLERVLAPIRVRLGALSGDGDLPRYLSNITLVDGSKVSVGPHGVPRLTPSLRVILERDDTGTVVRVWFQGAVPDMETLRDLTKRTREKYGIPWEQLERAAQAQQTKTPAANITFTFDEGFCRGILKMACNLFSTQNKDLFLTDGFDSARSLVLTGGPSVHHVVPDIAYVPNSQIQMGPLDHLLAVRGHAQTGRVEGMVVLYGWLPFVVFLGYGVFPSDVRLTYRVDPLGRQCRTNHPDDLALMVPHFHNTVQLDREHISILEAITAARVQAIFGLISQHEEQAYAALLAQQCARELFGTDQVPWEATPDQTAKYRECLQQRIALWQALFETGENPEIGA